MITVATFSLPSDAAEEQSVVSRAQYGEMSHGGKRSKLTKLHGYNSYYHWVDGGVSRLYLTAIVGIG